MEEWFGRSRQDNITLIDVSLVSTSLQFDN